MRTLAVEPLTKAAFAPFGDVLETGGAQHFSINQGFAERFHDLAKIEAMDGSVIVSIFEANPRPQLELIERHPLGTQIFYPLQQRSWHVVVCTDPHDPASFRAFRAEGWQGVNYGRNVWHHPLLVSQAKSRFLVIDRKGPGNNLEEVPLREPMRLAL
jgi:ureidoglycolate lyase